MKYKVGDKLVIANNDSNHGFDVGESVKIVKIDSLGNYFAVSDESGKGWWVDDDDVKPVSQNKPQKGDTVRITENWCGHNFEIGEVVLIEEVRGDINYLAIGKTPYDKWAVVDVEFELITKNRKLWSLESIKVLKDWVLKKLKAFSMVNVPSSPK